MKKRFWWKVWSWE